MTKLSNPIKGCILPWIHMHGNITGQYKVCCVSTGATTENMYNFGTHNESLLDVWNNEHYKNIRKQFLNNEIPIQCKKVCYDKEQEGGHSHRQEINQYWNNKVFLQAKTSANGTIKTPPIYFDIRFGNICNFRCRMCGSFASSQLQAEDRLLKKTVYPITDMWTNNDNLWKNLKKFLPYIEQIYFGGGEPLIQEGHYKLLHFLIENNKTDIRIEYNTNLSVLNYKTENIFDLWKNFKNVKLFISQDGFKEVGEYIRKGLNWKVFDSNFKKVMPYVETISCVAQVYNIYNIPKLMFYCKQQYKVDFYPSILTSPEEFSIQILSRKEKNKIIKHYKDFIKNSNYKDWEIKRLLSMLKFMKHEPDNKKELQQEFKIRTQFLDQYRNENFIEIVPEIAEWYKSIKVLA